MASCRFSTAPTLKSFPNSYGNQTTKKIIITHPPLSQLSDRRIREISVRAKMRRIYKGTHMREQQLTAMIEQKVSEAERLCEADATSDGCKVAWDEVEEISQAMADLRLKLRQQQDPLEFFCQENPETDECRIFYED